MFRFKQFEIEDDYSSMKVGTDAVLLGCWAALPETGLILDVGSGCGVISLMMAQRAPECEICGVDIHVPSIEQARRNQQHSPFTNVSFYHYDFLDASQHGEWTGLVNCIVSNPPYHTENLKSPKEGREAARSEEFLPFPMMVKRASDMLMQEGHLQVILPTQAQSIFHDICNQNGLSLCRQTLVRTTPQKEPKRVLLDFVKGRSPAVVRTELTLQDSCGLRSKTYSDLCKDFYL